MPYPAVPYFNNELQAYEVYIDESQRAGTAGYGIFVKQGCSFNTFDSVLGEKTLQNATYQGIIRATKLFPTDLPLVFVIDRKSVIDVLINFSSTYKKQQNTLHMDVLKEIQALFNKRQ